jgi:hypothetical protein
MNPDLKLVIAHPNETGGVSIIYPMTDCGLTVQDIAQKDVPVGVPYLFIPLQSVPTDHTFFNAFEVDFSQPSGYGIGAEEWFNLQQTAGQETE